MILVEGIRCDVFQCLSYRWKRRKDIERMAKKNTYDAGSIAVSWRDWKRSEKDPECI